MNNLRYEPKPQLRPFFAARTATLAASRARRRRSLILTIYIVLATLASVFILYRLQATWIIPVLVPLTYLINWRHSRKLYYP